MKLLKATNGVEYIVAENIRSAHGFSTRVGGVSRLLHTASLNLAFGRGDERDTVLENLSLFADAVGFDAESVVSVSQIHSADVTQIEKAHRGQGYFKADEFQCDGYVTNISGITLGVKTADCVPIFMEGYNENGDVCVVGAVHAGWQGTVNGIVLNCLEKMKGYGAAVDSIHVAIGPAICMDCFEVRRDFYDKVHNILGAQMTERFVISDDTKEGVWHTDLREMNKEFLISAGVIVENIEMSEDCTCCMPDRYFSHRYSKGERGTMLSVIVMP